jgi:hypothetical protein
MTEEDGVKIKGKQFAGGYQDFGSGDNSVNGQPQDQNQPRYPNSPPAEKRRPYPGPRVIVDGKEEHW